MNREVGSIFDSCVRSGRCPVRYGHVRVRRSHKRGLVAARDALRGESSVTPFDVYRAIDLGPGGYARAPARQAKRAVRALLRRKRSR